MRKLMTLLATFMGVSALGGDIVWLKLGPQFTYKDIDVACTAHSSFLEPIFFASEVVDGVVVRASLRKTGGLGGEKKIDLTSDEIARVAMHVSKKSEHWIKSIHLSTRLLNWMFYYSGDSIGGCKPPHQLKSIQPATQDYAFDLAPLDKDFEKVATPNHKFKGVNVKGGNYETTLRLEQTQFENSNADVKVQDFKGSLTAVAKATVKSTEEIGAKLAEILPRVYLYLEKQGIEPSSAPFARYFSRTGDEIKFEAGFLVREKIGAQGDIRAGLLEAGKVATVVHVGPYEKLGDTYGAIYKWMAQNKKEPKGAGWEIYVSDPTEVKPEELKTEIYIPIK